MTNGLGSIAAAVFGSCFPTTIYIGHPGWKAMGARTGYSILNAVFFTIVCLGGAAWRHHLCRSLIDAGMAIVLYIGIVITAGVPGDAAGACPGGCRRLAARRCGLGHADGQASLASRQAAAQRRRRARLSETR